MWRIHPDHYDENAGPAYGGQLYEAQPKPVNCARDGTGRVIVAQDGSPAALRISADGTSAEQIAIPEVTMTGPGCVASPDGSVWLASIMCGGSSPNGGDCGRAVRFHPGSDSYEIVQLITPWYFNMGRIQHFAFQSNPNLMYILTTSLNADERIAPEQVVQISWDESWQTWDQTSRTFTSLGTYSNSHRICHIEYTSPTKKIQSLGVTFWAADGLLQVFNDTDGHRRTGA